MADEIQQAPRASHTTVAPTQSAVQPQATPTSPRANFSRPTTSNDAAQNATATAPSATTSPPAAAQPTTTTEEKQTLNERLNNADRYWKFKGALQACAIIVGLIGIGTLGWCMSQSQGQGYGYGYGYNGTWSLWPALLTFACSVIWCAACIIVLVLRKRPVHPGLRVAVDLILWLGFIVTALFIVVSFAELTTWGEYGDLGSYYGSSSRYGDYELQSNGTWVWEQDPEYASSSSYLRDCEKNSTRNYYSYGPTFADCAEQDAYVNKLWQEKPHRESVQLTGVVCQFFSLIIHLVLFIWACVDCARHNRKKVSKDAEVLAASIVQTMITNGAVIPPPGQAHMRAWGQQPMGYYQLPPHQQGQAYPMQAMYPYPHPQQGMAVVPGQPMIGPQTGFAAAGPSNEKSQGPRYA